MTDFSAAAPFDPGKHDELHDQTKVAPPGPPTRDFLRRHLGIILGALFTIGFVALAFQARAGWENHREWVVAIVVPGLAIGGLAASNLIVRGKVMLLAPGLVFVGLSILFMIMNLQRATHTTGQDNGRDALSILMGISLAIALHLFTGAFIWNEWKNPVRPPQPEM